MIKIVIFDFDDTIVDNIKMDYESFSFPCKKFGINMKSFEDIINFRKNKMKSNEIIQILLKENNVKFEEFFNTREKFLVDKKSFDLLELKKNINKVLKFLNENKIKLILCTSRDDPKKITEFLKKNQILDYFSKIITRDDLNLNMDNRNYLQRLLTKNILMKKILRVENSNPNEVLYIGNAKEDWLVAKNMMINFVGFQNYYLTKNNFSDKNITDMIEIINEFKKRDEVGKN
jgi:phosphoglycolate phosphatase-like HAD superfamily hydrolase